MTSAESYRKLAAEFLAKALNAPNVTAAAEWDAMARAYVRLAEHAEQNRFAAIWAEFGPSPQLD